MVELLVVLIIMPLVVGAIAAVVLISLKDQNGISGRLSDSASGQTTSAFYVRDVESAAFVTTNPSPSSPEVCGTGTTFELGLTWGSPNAGGSVVSYWEDPVAGTPPTMNLVRLYCTGGSGTPVSSVAVAQGLVATSGISVGVTPPPEATAAASNWTSTAGTSSITMGALQAASNFHFDLVAVPRVYTPQSEGVSGGGTPLPPPMLLLGTGVPALSCAGNAHLNVSGTAYLNASASGSISMSGNNAIVHATQIDVADPTPSTAITGVGVTPSTPVYEPAVPDPYGPSVANLQPPSSSGQPVYTDGANHGPGVYTTTLTFSSPGDYVLATGTYILDQGISVSGQANLSSGTGGVLLYVKGGFISFSGQGNVSLNPLSPAPYAAAPNLGIWQDRSDTNVISLSGSASANTYSGTIYAPTAQVGGSGNAGYTAGGVISSSFACAGNGIANIGG